MSIALIETLSFCRDGIFALRSFSGQLGQAASGEAFVVVAATFEDGDGER